MNTEVQDIADRAAASAETFHAAKVLAEANGMKFLNPSAGCYQLRHLTLGWIINMYPRSNGISPRMYHDPHHRGPFLKLPNDWTLLDAVKAAVSTLGKGEVQS